MHEWQFGLFVFVILARLGELVIAQYNAKWAKKHGGYEVGGRHYPLFILLHVLFLLGIWFEAQKPPNWWLIPFVVFILAQIVRIWAIVSLGRFWNTRIWIVPGYVPKVTGPYRYVRHPNYLVVIVELLTFPLLYQAYLTLILISLFNAYLLFKIRMPTEEAALRQATNYQELMGNKQRLWPRWKSLLR